MIGVTLLTVCFVDHIGCDGVNVLMLSSTSDANMVVCLLSAPGFKSPMYEFLNA